MPLTDIAIRSLKPESKPVKLFDGGGLYIEVAPSGGKWWRLKYRFGGKEKRISFGVYPTVSLKDARKRRDEAKEHCGSKATAIKFLPGLKKISFPSLVKKLCRK